MNLTGQQLQKLQDRYNLNVGLENGTVVLSRKDGLELKAITVSKMLGLRSVPVNWTEHNGQVRNV